MTDLPTPARLTLRQLPLAAKLVLSVFLVAVGVGYFSALIQLHMQHSGRNGEALPTLDDVVEVFAGVKKLDPNAPPPAAPVCKLEKLIMGPIEGAPWNGSGSMAPAFFERDGTDYKKQIKERPKAEVDAERNGERLTIQAWLHTDDAARVAAYKADKFALPVDLTGKPISPDYLHEDKKAVKIKTVLFDRCERCHAKGADASAENYPLETYEQLTKYMEVPKGAEVLPGGWVHSDRQVSVEKLTQSTHAHLLSFAMLFTLTGLIFAFTGYPGGIRVVVAPVVLLAQVVDVACWWLARMPDYGPSFAMVIPFTGGIVGAGLMLQIVLSLFNMYGWKGKAVLLLLLVGTLAGGGVLADRVILPALSAERAVAEKAKADQPALAAKPDGKK
jgi:hypothetical protein